GGGPGGGAGRRGREPGRDEEGEAAGVGGRGQPVPRPRGRPARGPVAAADCRAVSGGPSARRTAPGLRLCNPRATRTTRVRIESNGGGGAGGRRGGQGGEGGKGDPPGAPNPRGGHRGPPPGRRARECRA